MKQTSINNLLISPSKTLDQDIQISDRISKISEIFSIKNSIPTPKFLIRILRTKYRTTPNHVPEFNIEHFFYRTPYFPLEKVSRLGQIVALGEGHEPNIFTSKPDALAMTHLIQRKCDTFRQKYNEIINGKEIRFATTAEGDVQIWYEYYEYYVKPVRLYTQNLISAL